MRQVLLPITAVMTLSESKAKVNRDGVFTYGVDKMRKQAADQTWKRLRVGVHHSSPNTRQQKQIRSAFHSPQQIACTCPFSPDRIGLSFVIINGTGKTLPSKNPATAGMPFCGLFFVLIMWHTSLPILAKDSEVRSNSVFLL